MERIAVVGTSGAGKICFSHRIAVAHDIPHVELDSLYWGPNWNPVEADDFRKRVDDATIQQAWVCDGNHRTVREIVWGRADTIIWLDYPFWVVFFRALRRTFTRCYNNTTLYSNNRESFRKTFSRDSILLWVLKTYWKRRKEYSILFTSEKWSGINVIQLRSTSEAAQFLNQHVDG